MTKEFDTKQDNLDEGILCCNVDCSGRSICARFYDPLRTEFSKMTDVATVKYDDKEDGCFKLRKQLEGTMDNHRLYQKKVKMAKTKHYRLKSGRAIGDT